ncbi:hypothetical protein ACH4TC_01210 [Streptomyces spororaveus]|uniref:hypothetical protein n=1 Tax=Streptomyces spororaveus TaxID=284039 RepID=UPI0037B8B227
MTDQPTALSADQAAAASSLLRLLADRLKSRPADETFALAQHMLTPDGLLSDIQHLLRRIAWWADTTDLPETDDGPLSDARWALDASIAELDEVLLIAKAHQLPVASGPSILTQPGHVAAPTPARHSASRTR